MNLDRNRVFYNQLVDGDFTECGGIAASDIQGNIIGIAPDPDFSYAMGLRAAGSDPTTAGSDPKADMDGVVCWGILPASAETFTAATKGELWVANYQNYPADQQAIALQYTNLGVKNIGADFDAIKAYIQQSGWGVSLPVHWYQNFTTVGTDGRLPSPNGGYTLHCVAVYGTIVVDGNDYLIVKPWLGPNYGSNGYAYLSRQVFAMIAQGAYGYDYRGIRWAYIVGLMVARFPYLIPWLPSLLKANQSTMPQTQFDPTVIYPNWDDIATARHNVRVICDQEGLSVSQKDQLSATLHCESGYNVNCIHPNTLNGEITSTDYGICQVNDYYHIGVGKDFPSSEYVISHPEAVVRWMAKKWLAGEARQWVCFSKVMYQHFSA